MDGDFQMLLMDDESIFTYTRKNENLELLVVCNFYGRTVSWPLDGYDTSMELLLSNYKDTDQIGVLRPYEARMYLKAN